MLAEAVADASPESPRDSKPVILVVDDEPGLRELVCRMLQDHGFTTMEAAQGGEALQVMEHNPDLVDLVVTDVVMPGMDGRELGRRISQRWPELPIIYISAYDVNDIFRRGSPRTEAPFLQKPFEADRLVTTIRGLLSARSPR